MTNDWEMDHVGIVVKDVNEAIKYYRRIGMEVLSSPELRTFDGKPRATDKTRQYIPVQYKACFIQNQAIRIELIQPMAGEDLFRQYLDKYGEGVHLIGFLVKDLQEEKDKLIEKGIPVISSVKRPDGSDMEILFDTRKYGNLVFALFSEPAPFPIFKSSAGRWKFNHLGLVTRDTDKLYEYHQLIGFKPLAPPRELVFDKVQGMSIHGKTPTVPQKTTACQFQNKSGTFLFEVNQPADDGSLHRDFLDHHGDGINHIHFSVDSQEQEKELADMEAKGFPAMGTSRRPDGRLFDVFYDTRDIGYVSIALWGGPGPFKPRPE